VGDELSPPCSSPLQPSIPPDDGNWKWATWFNCSWLGITPTTQPVLAPNVVPNVSNVFRTNVCSDRPKHVPRIVPNKPLILTSGFCIIGPPWGCHLHLTIGSIRNIDNIVSIVIIANVSDNMDISNIVDTVNADNARNIDNIAILSVLTIFAILTIFPMLTILSTF
jgi:hypothetical protein